MRDGARTGILVFAAVLGVAAIGLALWAWSL